MFEFWPKLNLNMQLLLFLNLSSFFWILISGSNAMSYVNEIPKLNGQNYGKWYQKLEITLAMADIDLAVTVPAPKEPEKPVRAQNEIADA